MVSLLVQFGTMSNLLKFTVLYCDCPTILGMPFLTAVNPDIDWVNKQVKIGCEVQDVLPKDDNQFSGLDGDVSLVTNDLPVVTKSATCPKPVKPFPAKNKK